MTDIIYEGKSFSKKFAKLTFSPRPFGSWECFSLILIKIDESGTEVQHQTPLILTGNQHTGVTSKIIFEGFDVIVIESNSALETMETKFEIRNTKALFFKKVKNEPRVLIKFKFEAIHDVFIEGVGMPSEIFDQFYNSGNKRIHVACKNGTPFFGAPWGKVFESAFLFNAADAVTTFNISANHLVLDGEQSLKHKRFNAIKSLMLRSVCPENCAGIWDFSEIRKPKSYRSGTYRQISGSILWDVYFSIPGEIDRARKNLNSLIKYGMYPKVDYDYKESYSLIERALVKDLRYKDAMIPLRIRLNLEIESHSIFISPLKKSFLLFNSFSSNHQTSIFKPILLTILASVIFNIYGVPMILREGEYGSVDFKNIRDVFYVVGSTYSVLLYQATREFNFVAFFFLSIISTFLFMAKHAYNRITDYKW